MKSKYKFLIAGIIFLILLAGIVFSELTESTGILKEKGYTGIEVISFTSNNSKVILESKVIESESGVSLDIIAENIDEKEQTTSMSILHKIDYDKIIWNGKRYNITEKPLILSFYINNLTGEKVIPNIFFGKENKRINYKDVVENGGYVSIYQKDGINYIETIVPESKISSFSKVSIDPTYSNSTAGFYVGDSVSTGRTLSINGTTALIGDTADNKLEMYKLDGTYLASIVTGEAGINAVCINDSSRWYFDVPSSNSVEAWNGGARIKSTALFSTITGAEANDSSVFLFGSAGNINETNITISQTSDRTSFMIPAGMEDSTDIAINGSDFWFCDVVDDSVNHTSRTGTHLSDYSFNIGGFGIGNCQGIGINVTGTPSSIAVYDDTDKFVYILLLTDDIIPFINQTFPDASLNNSWFNNNFLDVNVSISDANLRDLWYSNDTFSVNLSLGTYPTFTNLTNITWSEGNHSVIFYVNDSANNLNYTRKFKFWIDTESPNITILTPSNLTSTSTTTQLINVSTGDFFNVSYCDINITKGASVELSTKQINCSQYNYTHTFSGTGTYVIHAFVKDNAGNVNLTSHQIEITSSGGEVGGGGGGATTIIIIGNETITKAIKPICDPYDTKLKEVLQNAKPNELFLTIFKNWRLILEKGICKSLASITPLDNEELLRLDYS
jgi:hypothetical protein